MTNTTIRRVQHTAVIGPQWGDEGKGKIVDMLAQKHDIVVRYGGGANAGHTVDVGNEEFVLHLVPCGAIYGKLNVIGNGCVINLDRLTEEINHLSTRGKEMNPGNLKISGRAHITTPYKLLLDLAEEIVKAKRTGGAVGTTLQGIGPTYQFKVARTGIRMTDFVELLPSDLEEKIGTIAEEVENRIKALGLEPCNISEAINSNDQTKRMTRALHPYLSSETFLDRRKIMHSMIEHRERFAGFVTDISYFLSEQMKKGQRIMFEGAQGTLLDIDHGTYPHVTSSNTTIGGIFTGTGIYVDVPNRLGVMKAYTTRVGNGEFPTELKDEAGKRLQEKGAEFGATTGRARRCGWLDLVIGKYAVRVNGLNQLAMTKLDILDGEKDIQVCVAYELDGHQTDVFPASEAALARAKPVYQTLAGWMTDTSKARKFEDLPENARNLAIFVEQYLETPIKYISIGKERDQVIVR